MHNHYEYKVEQSHFEKENKESLKIVCNVVITCESGKMFTACNNPKFILPFPHLAAVGTHGSRKGKLYSVEVSGTKVTGSMLDKDSQSKGSDTKAGKILGTILSLPDLLC